MLPPQGKCAAQTHSIAVVSTRSTGITGLETTRLGLGNTRLDLLTTAGLMVKGLAFCN